MGHIHNNLTGFDALSNDGTTFSNFIANGCTSETSHIALLQGAQPREIDQPSSDSYPRYKTYTNPLPAFFNDLGYKTVFVSTVPLSFLNQRKFLSGMNFSTIIGEEAFINQPKYVFDAAPDSALYDKALSVIRAQKGGKPLFLAMQTISSHKPYRSP